MPKVVRFHETGGPEVLRMDDVASPQPGAGEVRLKVQAVGLNRAESLFFHGLYTEAPKLPSLLGYEGAGTVVAVGPDVDPSWLGKQVSTIPSFSMNRYGLLGEEALAPVAAQGEYPSTLSPEQGAAIWMQYLTAYGALVGAGNIQTKDFVLITAASSSVGLAAIEIVRAEGATAIAATRSAQKVQELKKLGAHHVVVTSGGDLPARVREITGGKGARLLFDPVAGPFVEQLAQSAAAEGILFIYGLLSMQPTPFPVRTAISRRLSMRGYGIFELVSDPNRLAEAKQYIFDRLQDGRFEPKIARSFPFAQTVEAYRYLESNEQVGKVVISIRE